MFAWKCGVQYSIYLYWLFFMLLFYISGEQVKLCAEIVVKAQACAIFARRAIWLRWGLATTHNCTFSRAQSTQSLALGGERRKSGLDGREAEETAAMDSMDAMTLWRKTGFHTHAHHKKQHTFVYAQRSNLHSQQFDCRLYICVCVLGSDGRKVRKKKCVS